MIVEDASNFCLILGFSSPSFHNFFLYVFRCSKPCTEGYQKLEESDLSEAIPRGM
jgi:hypothetical protein